MNAQQRVRRHRRLAAILAAAVTTSMIGFAPPAAAHGLVQPPEVCEGPQIAGGMCDPTAAVSIPGHLTEAWRTDPHGSKQNKLAERRLNHQGVPNAAS